MPCKPLGVRSSTAVARSSLMPWCVFLGTALELQWVVLLEMIRSRHLLYCPGNQLGGKGRLSLGNITPPFCSFCTYSIISPGLIQCHERKGWTLGQETHSAHISLVTLGRIVNLSETPFFSTTLPPHLAVGRIKLWQYISKWHLSFKVPYREATVIIAISVLLLGQDVDLKSSD